jgi:hypothetical protein
VGVLFPVVMGHANENQSQDQDLNGLSHKSTDRIKFELVCLATRQEHRTSRIFFRFVLADPLATCTAVLFLALATAAISKYCRRNCCPAAAAINGDYS